MDRRGFFKDIFARTVNAGVDVIDNRAQAKAKHWFRPPFAINELDFLLACTRCGDCVDACPHQVIFNLSLAPGAEVAGTPALDLLNKGCHLCQDWACVNACKTQALVFPKPDEDDEDLVQNQELKQEEETTNEPVHQCPPLATAVINTNHCIAYAGPECGACRGSCPIPNTLLWQGEKPSINLDSCLGCGLCRETCITTPNAIELDTV